MKKQLVFIGGDDLAKSRAIFAALFLAVRFGRGGQQAAPGIETLRKERRIKTAMKSIGEPDPAKQNDLQCQKCGHVVMTKDPVAYRLRDTGGSIVLEQGDVDQLRQYIDKGFWTGEVAEDMADADDFLSSAPEVKEVKEPVGAASEA